MWFTFLIGILVAFIGLVSIPATGIYARLASKFGRASPDRAA
jgi:glycerol uptake facilitator-like aquaporin